MRTCFAAVTAGAKYEDTTAAFVYNGTWTSNSSDGAASGSSSTSTSTVGDSVDVGFTGDTAWVVVRAQAAALTVTVTPSGTPTPNQTIDLSGRYQAVPHAIKLSGYGAGTHSARITLTAGGPLVVDCLLTPSTTPPGVVFIEEGDVLTNWGAIGAAASNSFQDNTVFPAVEAMIAADFPNCVIARFNPGWDYTTMTGPDGDHLNDRGNAHVADNLVYALQSLPFSTGLNFGSTNLMSAPSVYTPVWNNGSTAAPGQVSGVTTNALSGQVYVSWSIPANNGAAITDYTVQWRTTSGPGAWNTFAHTASSAPGIYVTGLSNGTSYDFQVAAVNSVGRGPYSAFTTRAPAATHFAAAQQTVNAVATANGTVTVSLAQTATVGNVLVAAYSSGSPTASGSVTLPSGWTAAGPAPFSSDKDVTYMAYRVATAADVAGTNYSFGYSTNVAANATGAAQIVELAGLNGTLNTTGSSSSASSLNPPVTGKTATTTNANCAIVGAVELYGASTSAWGETWAAQSTSTAATWNDLGGAGALSSSSYSGIGMGMAVVSATGTYGGAVTTSGQSITLKNFTGVVVAFVLT
jgi:hypothetical protein